MAPEAANNAVQGGALIPALTLGIPGNSDSAVFLAGLMMYGINPGMPMVWVVAAVGYVMRRTRFPVVPLLMAVILGPIAEKNFMRAMIISDYSYANFFRGYLNWIIWALIVFAWAFPSIMALRRNRRQQRGRQNPGVEAKS